MSRESLADIPREGHAKRNFNFVPPSTTLREFKYKISMYDLGARPSLENLGRCLE
jgi:hypothetical protein